MAIGSKAGSIRNLKKSLAKGGQGSVWIKYIPKNSSMNVRFIQEPEEWVNYVEHWDDKIGKSYPCNGEADCPGCNSGARRSGRYLANAVDTDTDRIIPLQLPKDLATRLVTRYERNGTLTDRDYELSRAGDKLDTVYDLEGGPVSRRNLAKYTPLDLISILEDAYKEVFGIEDDDDEEDVPVMKPKKKRAAAEELAEEEDEPKPKKKGKKGKSKAAAVIEEDVDDEDDDDEDVEVPVREKPALAAARKKHKAAAVVEDEPDEEEDDESEDDEDEVYDEETLSEMSLGALRALARSSFGLSTKGKAKADLVKEILASGEEVEDDEDEDEDDEIPF